MKSRIRIFLFVLILLSLNSLFILSACANSSSKYHLTAKDDLIPKPPKCEQAGQTWVSQRDGMEMVCVPRGEFYMGGAENDQESLDREKPLHKVYLDAYWIDKTEVTNEMFAKFVEATDYKTWSQTKRNNRSYVFSEDPNIVWEDKKGANWKNPEGAGSSIKDRMNHPVVHIHKDDAEAYCRWAGRRLPTEAEWEKAARGDDIRIYPWGNQPINAQLANIADSNLPFVKWADNSINDGYRYTAPVGSYPLGKSPYGALDMAGNVWEIVSDWADWDYYKNSPQDNPTGPTKSPAKQLPIIRGGSWYSSAFEIRTSHRAMPAPNKSSVVVGFRCAVSSP